MVDKARLGARHPRQRLTEAHSAWMLSILFIYALQLLGPSATELVVQRTCKSRATGHTRRKLATLPGPVGDGCEGYDLTALLTGAATNEYEKLTVSPHFSTLQKVAAAAELSIPKLAFDSDQDGGTPQREAPADAPSAGLMVTTTPWPGELEENE